MTTLKESLKESTAWVLDEIEYRPSGTVRVVNIDGCLTAAELRALADDLDAQPPIPAESQRPLLLA